MALTLIRNARNFPFCVVAKGDAGLGASLPPGAAVVITADPADLAVLSLDPNPLPLSNPFDPAAGARSVASGVVAVGSQPGTATITAAILNPDGSTLAEATDTLTVVQPGAGIAEWAGELFGSAAPIDLASAGGTKKGHTPKENEGHKHHTPR